MTKATRDNEGERVSAALKVFRRHHDLSLSEMAQLLNVNRTTLSNWEKASHRTHHERTRSFFYSLETLEENPIAQERLRLLLLRSSRSLLPDSQLQSMLPRALQIFRLSPSPRRLVERLHAFLRRSVQKHRPLLLSMDTEGDPQTPP